MTMIKDWVALTPQEEQAFYDAHTPKTDEERREYYEEKQADMLLEEILIERAMWKSLDYND